MRIYETKVTERQANNNNNTRGKAADLQKEQGKQQYNEKLYLLRSLRILFHLLT